jgi:hypothetical protein
LQRPCSPKNLAAGQKIIPGPAQPHRKPEKWRKTDPFGPLRPTYIPANPGPRVSVELLASHIAGYASLLLWSLLFACQLGFGIAVRPVPEPLGTLLLINGALLAWRLAMRFCFVARAYGWREGLRSVPRVLVGNAIAMLAARKAVMRYLGWRRGRPAPWEKTVHAFPETVPAE